jgi:CheY-like chemotaxis protein
MTKAAILCVDDEDIPRTLRQLVLQKQGYEVVAVSSGKEALATLATRHFDLVLTDQMMPGMMGTELTRQVKLANPATPVVIISGVNELPADSSYADRFISKIEGPEALFRGIAEVLSDYRQPEAATAHGLAASAERHRGPS